MRGARDEILPAAGDVVAVARQRRKPGAAERLEQAPIREAVARHQIEGAAEAGVAPYVEMIRSIALCRRRHVVPYLRGAVGTGIQRGDRAPDRVSEECGKGIPGSIGGDCTDARDALIRPRAFVVGEEERAVADDRAADRESRLRALVFRIGLPFRREIIRGVERAVPYECVRGALKLVGARLHHHADLRRALAAMRRFGRARQHLELLNRIHRRAHARRVELGIDVVGAVEQEAVEVFASAVDAERKVAAHRSRRSLRSRDGTGSEQCQLQKVPAVEGHVEYLAVFDDGSDRRRITPHIRSRCRYFDAFGHRADLQLRVRAALLIHREHNALHLHLVALHADLDPPCSGRQLREGERSRIAARRRACFVGGLVDRSDGGSGDHGARCILHASTYGATMTLRIHADRQHENPCEHAHRPANHHDNPLVSNLFHRDVFK